MEEGTDVASFSFFPSFLFLSLTWSPVFAPIDGRRDETAAVLAAIDDRDFIVVVGGRLDDGARLGAAVVVGRVEQVRS